MKLKQIIFVLEEIPKGYLIALGILLNGVVGLIDYCTGKYVGMEIFYLLPISLVTWFTGKKPGVFIALLSTLTLVLADITADRRHYIIEFWNPAVHFGMFVIFACLISGIRRALDEIAEGKNVLSSILDSAGEGIYGIDRNGNHTMVNPAAVRMLGHKVEEIIGRHSHQIWHHTRADGTPYPQEQCRIYATLRDGIAKRITDEVFWRKDGTSFPVDYTVAPISEKGDITGAVIVFRDITESKRTEEALRVSEARYRTLYSENPTMIFTLSAEGTILSANPSAADELGYSQDELEGKAMSDVIHEEDRSAMSEQLQACLKNPGQTYRSKVRKVRKDGATLWVEEIAQTVGDVNGNLNVLVVCQDITERKRAEEYLIRTMEELARSNKDLEQFAYAVSHDLQAPLRSIGGFAEMLSENYMGRLDGEADKYLNFIVSGAARMKRMIDDILAYSRVGTRAEEPTSVGFETALLQAMENLQATISERGAVITHDPLPAVKADKSQIVLLLQNLIDNAIKFSTAQPGIHLSAAKRGKEWIFSVKDNGIGIDPAQAGRIFTLFQRLHTEEEYPGTGVGLAICKKIVDRHKGKIWVESAPGSGSTFYFSLPAGD